MTLLIAIDGVAPGVGKSTLAAALADHFARRGVVVDHFREEEILTRPACTTVAEQFHSRGEVDPAALIDATKEYLLSLREAEVDVAVLDAFVPFLQSMLGWGYDDDAIDEFVRELTGAMAGTPKVLVYLDGDPQRALERAIQREEDGWFDWLIDRLKAAREPAVRDLDSLCEHFDRRRELTLRLLHHHGWQVLTVSNAIATPLPRMIDDLAGRLSLAETP